MNEQYFVNLFLEMDCLVGQYCCMPNEILWYIYKKVFALYPDNAFFILFIMHAVTKHGSLTDQLGSWGYSMYMSTLYQQIRL